MRLRPRSGLAAGIVGAALVALAGIGVVRLGDVYARMHAASKASTLGLALIGAAAALAIDDAAAKARALARPGDVVFTIGAGDVVEVGPKLLELLP